MLQKLVGAVLLSALVVGPAAAQVALSPFNAPNKRPMTQEEMEKKKAADAAYKAAMDKIPEKKGGADPWGNVRDAPQTANAPTAKTKPQ
jgi:hypothetical protein